MGPTSWSKRGQISASNAQLLRPEWASVSQAGAVESLHTCFTVWRQLLDSGIDREFQRHALDRMTQAFMIFVQFRGGKFERL